MPSPEKTPPPKPAELVAAKVPWGARKPAAPASVPATPVAAPSPAPVTESIPVPEPAAPAALSAKKVPWGSRKNPPPAPAPPPPPPDATVTHMPWAESSLPPPSAPAPVTKKNVFAKLVPWGSRKPAPPTPAPEDNKPRQIESATIATWALPKDTDAARGTGPATQEEMDFARDLRRGDGADHEPTAEQLVAYLSKLPARTKEAPTMSEAQDARAPYKARPISFEPTRWEIAWMWVQTYRRRLSIGAVLLMLALSTAYLWRLVSLDTRIDQQWRGLESALRDRYALVPAYVECLTAFSDSERYTMTITQRGLTAWHAARTDRQIAAAAARMEMVLTQLTKVMRRYDQSVPVKEAEQAESSAQFAKLERQKELSRQRTAELVQRYNAAVINFNSKVTSAPGSWLAWASNLHERSLLFTSAR